MLADRVKESTSSTGTGSFTTSGAFTGFRTVNAGLGVGMQTPYYAVNAANNEWEAGFGYLSAATTFVRDHITSNSAGTLVAISFTAPPTLFISQTAASIMQASTLLDAAYITSSHLSNLSSSSTYAIDANEIHYVPFHLGFHGFFDAFGLDILTGSGNARLALYDIKAGLPNNLIAVHDTSLDISTSGFKVATFDAGSKELNAGWYFVAITADGTPQINGAPSSGALPSPLGVNGVTANIIPNMTTSKTRTYAAMPSPADISGLTIDTLACVLFSLRKG